MAHSLLRRKLRMNRKGYSALIATIIMVLVILYMYFSVMMFSLNRNEDFQDVVSRSAQLDADRTAEQVTMADVAITESGQPGQLLVTCTLTNSGSVPVQMARIWIQDKSLAQNNVGNAALLATPVLLQSGSTIVVTFPPVTVSGAVSTDQFFVWIITFRGNSFSITVN